MLDATFVRENLDAVKENCRNRNVTVDVDRVAAVYDRRREIIQRRQSAQQRRNELSELIPKEKDTAKKQALIEENRELRGRIGEMEKEENEVEAELDGLLKSIPNMSHPDAPVGTTAEDNKVIDHWG